MPDHVADCAGRFAVGYIAGAGDMVVNLLTSGLGCDYALTLAWP